MLRNSLFPVAKKVEKKCYARLAEDFQAHAAENYFFSNPDLVLFMIIGQSIDILRNWIVSILPPITPRIAGQSFTELDFVVNADGDLLTEEGLLQASYEFAAENYLEFVLNEDGNTIEKISRVFRFDHTGLKIEALSGNDVSEVGLAIANRQFQARSSDLRLRSCL